MKIKYLIIIAVFTYQTSHSQNVVAELKHFYNNAPLDCYIDKIKKNINEECMLKNQGLSLFRIPPLDEINLNKDNTVFMLAVQFVNTETFNFSDDIYNYISIDSSRVFTLACVDHKKNVHAFANFFGGIYTYYDIKRDDPSVSNLSKKRLSRVILNITKQNPELILYCHSLEGWNDDNGFMYIKGNKIYVYNVPNGKIFELNDFIHKFYSLKKARDLNLEFIPLLYSDCISTRRTGHAPENEKMICQ